MKTALAVARAVIEAAVLVLFLAGVTVALAVISQYSGGVS